jgi:hypothetical protein
VSTASARRDGSGVARGRVVVRPPVASGVLVVALALAGCGDDGGARSPAPTSTFSAGGVEVRAGLVGREGADRELVVTLRPAAGFHLYGTDLPRGGVDGLGQRTEVRAAGALRRVGPLRADRRSRPLRVRGVRRPLRAYPAGPVRLRLPVRVAGSGRAVVVLSFGACSDRSCGPPVVDRRVVLAVR